MLKDGGVVLKKPGLLAGDYDTFEAYSRGRTLTNPELVALIKALRQ